VSIHQIIEIDSVEDPRLDPFRDLRHRSLTHFSQRFVAEGWIVVERLLRSDFETESVVCAPKYVDQIQAAWDKPGTIYVMPNEFFTGLVGFHFHRGALACAKRKPLIPVQDFSAIDWGSKKTLAGVVGVQDPENLGGILRTCAGLGIDTVLIGPDCCDPYSRRVLRTSMGNALKLRLLSSQRLIADLRSMQTMQQVQVLSTSLAADSKSLEEISWESRRLILLGNEGHGLPLDVQLASDVRVRIDMDLNTDSLNVSVAAGIILHYAVRLAG
jgi:tRNA G18 (ribose-2'-O)-methylase SpoU